MTALAAMAASTALPPASSTRTPAAAARGWLVATMPWVVMTRERPGMTVIGRMLPAPCELGYARIWPPGPRCILRHRARGEDLRMLLSQDLWGPRAIGLAVDELVTALTRCRPT